MMAARPSPLVKFEVHSNVLWRESRWVCEYGYESSQWVGTLYLDDEVIAQYADRLRAVLEMTQRWRDAVKTIPNDPQLAKWLGARHDRRGAPTNRRAVPRGGRRATDASRPEVPDWADRSDP